MKKLKIKLKEILTARNMTQAELAEIANVRPNVVSNLCRGYIDRIAIEHIEKICDALQLDSVSQLFELE